MGSKRDQIRAATVGAQKRFQSKVVTVNGQEIEVREPTLAERDAIERKKVGDETATGWARVALMIIAMSFEPGTNDRLFGDADYDGLMASSAGGWVNELGAHCARLYWELAADPEKNSAGTTGDTTSS